MDELSIFGQALELESPGERRRYLDDVCRDNAPLRDRIDALLDSSRQAKSFLEMPPVADIAAATTDRQLAEIPGTIIGHYKLLEQVGEGGMGVVYVAEQTEPVRRRVALKIIKPGMDTKQVIARFEAERQALAMMDHPNIARVLDAGTTEAGRPYFAMELVRGLLITEYCDKARLSPRQRLALFVAVCQAVQHAHQKGIIHRDLKPSNVMVTTNDGRPVVKVIDFGVAKAVGQQLTDRTIYTALAQLVGTPLYMSPEQAELTSNDVDTRSDVYSLGVLLYELLTGRTPFDKERMKSAGFDEMRRIIREEEPPRPSHCISTLNAQVSSTISQQRGLDERHLSRALRGELDWIVMKALEKDRSRRYESASALAADIQRYLSDEPVLACPPTTMYRFQKFARKHKAAFTTAAAIAVCLLLGTTVSAWQAVRATQAEAQATTNEAQAKASAQKADEKAQEAAKERDEAQHQRDEVKLLNDKLAAKDQLLQRSLYAAHMNLAKSALEESYTRRLMELLDQHRPKPGEADLRGFEWHYLNRQLHSEVLTLSGSNSTVPGDRSVAFSSDGKRLASGVSAMGPQFSRAGDIAIWDARTGRELLRLKGHTGPVYSVAFSPNGKRLASASEDKSIKIWDTQDGTQLLTCQGTTSGRNVAFSPDGKYVVTGARWGGGEINVFDAAAGNEVLKCVGHTDTIASVTFSPDGQRLASGSYDGTVKVWDAQSGQELITIEGEGRSIAFSPDGKYLAGNNNVWDAQTGQEILSIPKKTQINSVAFNPDGTWLATAQADGTTRLWDAKTGQELRALIGHTQHVNSVVFNADGTRLASTSGISNGYIKVWDITPQPAAFRTPEGEARCIAVSPNGKSVAAGSAIWNPAKRTYFGAVRVLNLQSGEELLASTESVNPVLSIAYSTNSLRLVVGTGAWDASKRVYSGGEVKVLDAASGKEILSCEGHMAGVMSVSFNSDGALLATSSSSIKLNSGYNAKATPGEVFVWDAQKGQPLFNLKGNRPGDLDQVAFSPDGQRLATSSSDSRMNQIVKIRNAHTGEEILTLPKLNATKVTRLAFSPDGKWLATGNLNLRLEDTAQINLFDAATGHKLLSLKGHSSGITGMAFSPDGKRLASCSANWEDLGEVKLWDTESGQELISFAGGARSVAFTPDGQRLVINRADGVEVLDATPLPELLRRVPEKS